MWTGPNIYTCPYGDKIAFHNNTSLTHHLKQSHNTHNNFNLLYRTISYLLFDVDGDIKWKLTYNNNSKIIDNLEKCPYPNCNMVCNHRDSLLSHIKSHSVLKDLICRFGWFWGTILCWIKTEHRAPTPQDFFRKTDGFICSYCHNSFSGSKIGMRHHMVRHDNLRVEDAQMPHPTVCSFTPILDVADAPIAEATQDDNPEENIVPHVDETPVNDNTDNANTSANEESNEDNAEFNSEIENDSDHSQARHKYAHLIDNRDLLLTKARQWIETSEREEEKGIRFPKMTIKNRSKIMEPIQFLFESKIDPLVSLMSTEESEVEAIICEGILCKISSLIRKTIRTALKIPLNYTTKKKSRDRDLIYNRSTVHSRNILSFSELADLLRKLAERENKADTTSNRNKINAIRNHIINCASSLPGDILKQIFGSSELHAITDFIKDLDQAHIQDKLEWLEATLLREEEAYSDFRSKKHFYAIRELYQEDPGRCVSWYICGDVSPECKISSEEFSKTYGEEWNYQGPNNMINWNLETKLFNAENALLLSKLDDIDKMIKVIQSRPNISATGLDGISNAIWKFNPKTSARLCLNILASIMNNKRAPTAWRKSKTVMIFKKGDPMSPKSWRPIALTPSLYRSAMSFVSECFQDINNINRFISINQKGFIRSSNGAAEHIATLNQLISNACIDNKSICLATLDFSNAFGSVDHKLIIKTLKERGFNDKILNMIKALYNNNETIIDTPSSSTKVHIGRGVRQGCPLSPLLFNMCLEPLLEFLESNHSDDGYSVGDYSFVAQAYADDVVIISRSHEGLQKILDTVCRYCEDMSLKLEPKKCCYLSYLYTKNGRKASSSRLNVSESQITPISLSSYIEYLGAPISTNKVSKMKFSQVILNKVESNIKQILLSPLKFIQKLDAIRRICTPSLDYIFLNGAVSLKKIKAIDASIRGNICRCLNASGIPINAFSTSWADGGLGLHNLVERYQVLQIRSYAGLKYSSDPRIRFLFNSVESLEKKQNMSNTLYSRAHKALQSLNARLDFKDDHLLLKLESDEEVKCNPFSIPKVLNRYLRTKHYKKLINECPFKGSAFEDLERNYISNKFIIDLKTRMEDKVAKFTLLGRLNCLCTNELLAKSNKEISKLCPTCKVNHSLMHILNKCTPSLGLIKGRHDAVAKIFADNLKDDHPDIPIFEDKPIFIKDLEKLPEEVASMKPDIWFCEEANGDLNITIIEFSIPFGTMTNDSNGARISSLSKVRQEKEVKYKALIRHLQNIYKAKVYYYVVVVSSLGAMPKETLKVLKDLFKKKHKNIAYKIVDTVCSHSYSIFNKKQRRNKTKSSNPNRIVSSSDDSDITVLDCSQDAASSAEDPSSYSDGAADETVAQLFNKDNNNSTSLEETQEPQRQTPFPKFSPRICRNRPRRVGKEVGLVDGGSTRSRLETVSESE